MTTTTTAQMVAYGATCTWWGNKETAAQSITGIPACPHCSRPLFEEDRDRWIDMVSTCQSELVPDYPAFIAWLEGRRCYQTFQAAAAEFLAETGEDEAAS